MLFGVCIYTNMLFNRGDSALSRQEIYPQLPHSGVTDLLNAGVANETIDSPRKLPPLTLPPVNKVNPEDTPDDQDQNKKKKKKHKKRHHEDVDHEDNGQINTDYDIDRTEN
ncbi:hypothetical protein LSH36_1582g00000 [Paralvinella palmiformis]|uniref:Uncharacterized protein n=1 Tax=Paralvinella palmiformis TaxID=53620 RepID=A0AAD9MQC7_9ANNE|nr:hypothetical protein LSH36_1582g00000 [Paralvinella palmiformis]